METLLCGSDLKRSGLPLGKMSAASPWRCVKMCRTGKQMKQRIRSEHRDLFALGSPIDRAVMLPLNTLGVRVDKYHN